MRAQGFPGLRAPGLRAPGLRALALRALGLDPRRRRGWHRAQAAEALRDARLHAAVRQMGLEAAWLARTAGRITKARL